MVKYHFGRKGSKSGFTLVELLVVIGIIAVLIGVLLPVLSSARKSAQSTKCCAALREIGNAFKMYALDNNQYYPPMRCQYIAANPYKVMFGGDMYQPVGGAQTYWMYFLAKYVSKQKFGVGATPEEISRALNSVLWGCPNFVPVSSTNATISVGGIAVVYSGYGYNGFPEYTAKYPDPATSTDKYDALGDSISYPFNASDPRSKAVSSIAAPSNGNWALYYTNTSGNPGTWYKMGNYTNSGERALVGDCRAYVLEALKSSGVNNFSGQGNINILSTTLWTNNTQSPADTGQSTYDYYRHGKYPGMEFPNAFNSNGGKISYNLLYADGHVQTLQTRDEGFKAARMRFPG
jgi:prepilin-type N-terminal cleavage/methylation domain-containing protein/prepilin-type processing-associated H-X9-DG protein